MKKKIIFASIPVLILLAITVVCVSRLIRLGDENALLRNQIRQSQFDSQASAKSDRDSVNTILDSVNTILSSALRGDAYSLEVVDMGLSVAWASCNLGATKPEEFGFHYAWGETSPKGKYTSKNYKWDVYKNTKYAPSGGKTKLDPIDDAAWASSGGKWRMPTAEEWNELKEKCSWKWSYRNGVVGYKVTSQVTGNSIFLPAAGDWDNEWGRDSDITGSCGSYWSSSGSGSCMLFRSEDYYVSSTSRHMGQSIRPVSAVDSLFTLISTASIHPRQEAIDMGLSVKWASANIGAAKPEDYGKYFAWGETSPKSNYSEKSYKWWYQYREYVNSDYFRSTVKITKYCQGNRGDFWAFSGESTDDLESGPDDELELNSADDAALANSGGKWRMPTMEEWQELLNEKNCKWTWSSRNGKYGYIVTSIKTGNSIFLPATGYKSDGAVINSGYSGYYWSKTLSDSIEATGVILYSRRASIMSHYRSDGLPVRPVLKEAR